jgi:site-specific recombinase XerD
MANINFYLKQAEEKTGRSLIYIQFHYDGQKLTYSFNEQINPDDWDKKKQLARNKQSTRVGNEIPLNKLINKLREILTNAYRTERVNGIPRPDTLKKYLDDYMNQNLRTDDKSSRKTLYAIIDGFIDGTIGDDKSDATITTYKTAKLHLTEFEKRTHYHVDFSTINMDFFYKYLKFLKSDRAYGEGKKKKKYSAMAQNSVKKEIKNIKTFMNMGIEMGWTTSLGHKSKKFKVEEAETDNVYLNDIEIRNLYKHNFKDNVRLESVRDLFVFSSFVGLRYSDASRIKRENIIRIDGEDYIKIIMQKTGRPVTIPMNDIVRKIIAQYKPIPPGISNQKFNQYLKEVCEEAGLTETGRLASDMNKRLCDAISSHTARRNFCTNSYLSGMDARMIMAVSGHKTEKDFLKYIKISDQENARRMSEHMKKAKVQNI